MTQHKWGALVEKGILRRKNLGNSAANTWFTFRGLTEEEPARSLMPYSRSREITSYVEVPARPIEAIATDALADVDYSIQRLTDWGVVIKRDSRLHQAREILEHAVHTRELVSKHRGDDLGLRALELAFDYRAIAESLPESVIANMKRELRDSLVGPINPPENERGPLQLQTQAVIRAAFVRAGEMPRHPTHSPKKGKSSPDLILDNGTASYSIEIKRPQFRKNIISQFYKGSAQIKNYGLAGGVVIDATDALRDVLRADLLDEVHGVALELYDRVFIVGHGYQPGMSHLMLIGVLARAAWHSDDSQKSAMVQVRLASTLGVFATTENNLAHHRARWMRKSLNDGLDQLDRILLERAKEA